MALGLVACDDAQSFTTSRGAVLAFSTDTVRFDTVISTVGSSTRQLMVYNRNGDGLRLRLDKGQDPVQEAEKAIGFFETFLKPQNAIV